MNESAISINKRIQGGTPCFRGTRVSIAAFFDYLEQENTLNEFLEDFPAVKREQVIKLLELAKTELPQHAVSAAS